MRICYPMGQLLWGFSWGEVLTFQQFSDKTQHILTGCIPTSCSHMALSLFPSTCNDFHDRSFKDRAAWGPDYYGHPAWIFSPVPHAHSFLPSQNYVEEHYYEITPQFVDAFYFYRLVSTSAELSIWEILSFCLIALFISTHVTNLFPLNLICHKIFPPAVPF